MLVLVIMSYGTQGGEICIKTASVLGSSGLDFQISSGDIVGVILNLDDNQLSFSLNGLSGPSLLLMIH